MMMHFLQWLDNKSMLGAFALAVLVLIIALFILIGGLILGVDSLLVFQTMTAVLGIGGVIVVLAAGGNMFV